MIKFLRAIDKAILMTLGLETSTYRYVSPKADNVSAMRLALIDLYFKEQPGFIRFNIGRMYIKLKHIAGKIMRWLMGK